MRLPAHSEAMLEQADKQGILHTLCRDNPSSERGAGCQRGSSSQTQGSPLIDTLLAGSVDRSGRRKQPSDDIKLAFRLLVLGFPGAFRHLCSGRASWPCSDDQVDLSQKGGLPCVAIPPPPLRSGAFAE